MKPSDIMLNIGRPVAYYAGFAKRWGPAAGAFFSQMFYWTDKQKDKDGWIYKTQEDIEEETGLSQDSQLTARNRLKAAGVMEEKYNRIEHKLYYRVMIDKLNEIFEGQSENPRLGKPTSSDPLKGTTETTTENTKLLTVPEAGTDDAKHAIGNFDPDELEAKPKKEKKIHLSPQTEVERKFFGIITEELRATYGKGKVVFWKSNNMRLKFLKTINRIGEVHLPLAVKAATERGILSLVGINDYIAKWEPNRPNRTYNKTVSKPNPPQEKLSPEEAKAFRERHQKIVDAGKNQ